MIFTLAKAGLVRTSVARDDSNQVLKSIEMPLKFSKLTKPF